jgi:hypothetical protein
MLHAEDGQWVILMGIALTHLAVVSSLQELGLSLSPEGHRSWGGRQCIGCSRTQGGEVNAEKQKQAQSQ